MADGHGPWFAVTSVSSDYGVGTIVGDGPTPADALAAGIAAIAPGLDTTQIQQLTVAQAGIKLQLEHLEILDRKHTLARVGVKGLRLYETQGPVRT